MDHAREGEGGPRGLSVANPKLRRSRRGVRLSPHDTDWYALTDGTVYDAPDCKLGHHGEDVSFNSILTKYQLTDPALLLLGEIVRASDSHPPDPHPAGEGLRWIAGGFGARGARGL